MPIGTYTVAFHGGAASTCSRRQVVSSIAFDQKRTSRTPKPEVTVASTGTNVPSYQGAAERSATVTAGPPGVRSSRTVTGRVSAGPRRPSASTATAWSVYAVSAATAGATSSVASAAPSVSAGAVATAVATVTPPPSWSAYSTDATRPGSAAMADAVSSVPSRTDSGAHRSASAGPLV